MSELIFIPDGGVPIDAYQEVIETCKPDNQAVSKAWDRCVNCHALAILNNELAVAYLDVAIAENKLSRNCLTWVQVMRLEGYYPLEVE